ncbi:hypothetical protein [Comamonas odontotermitis]|uniref:hypothetical protein n=1 Tax=Comamonas odontotermitis TaxID=379895 RepID=UPI001CC4CD8C|nr:hypothetical protein [Comamonas odontotermitis]UBB15705.1 hypothetical protein LAD35_12610 [Comamonas odontotermitis]
MKELSEEILQSCKGSRETPIQYASSTAQRLAKLPDSKERGSRGLFLVVATSWVADDFFRNFFWLSKPVLQYKASLIAAS